MPQQNTPTPKGLGRKSGSLNAPIAAFTMAIILCSYCISSIRSARREAQTQNSSGLPSQSQQTPSGRSGKEQSWVQLALEESQAGKRGEGNGKGKG